MGRIQFASNMPIWAVDLDGLEAKKKTAFQQFMHWFGLGNPDPATNQNFESRDDISNHYNSRNDFDEKVANLSKSLGNPWLLTCMEQLNCITIM